MQIFILNVQIDITVGPRYNNSIYSLKILPLK